jgi:hypothetical protein
MSKLISALKEKTTRGPRSVVRLKANKPALPKPVEAWGGNIFENAPVLIRKPKNKKLSPDSNHAAKPILTPVGIALFGDYLGVEMEFECAQGFDGFRDELVFDANISINGAQPNEPFCIFKHDGSLKGSRPDGSGGDYGFEMCSRPASIEEQKKRWKLFFNNLPEGMAVSARCGMHIHISKAALTPLQIGKIISFIHNPENGKFISKIAGRGSCTFSDFSVAKSCKHALRKYLSTFNHYSAVNILNGATLELRIFSGTTSFASFAKNLEFMHALAKFTVPGIVSIREARSVKAFVEFLSKNRKFYPYLVSFLANNGFGKTLKNIKGETRLLEVR